MTSLNPALSRELPAATSSSTPLASTLSRVSPALGRGLLALIFVASGLGKIASWDQTAAYMAAKNMPLVPLFLFGAIALEVLGGLSVLLGYKARLGATALLVFMIPATLIFHAFWGVEGMQRQMEMINFMKNLSIMGGLLMVVGLGAGAYSLDARSAAKRDRGA